MAPTPKDYPSFRSTFAQNKQDGSLDQLPLLIWGYRIGAGAFVIYSAYDFFATIYLCSVPVSGFGSSSRMTTCDYLAQVGLIYIVIIELILSVILLIGHLASIVLSVFVLRWRKQWTEVYESKSTTTPFHPGRAFMYFTAASVGNAAFLLLIGIVNFCLRAFGGGFGFALVGVIGGLYTAYLGRQMWSINFDQPLANKAAVPNVGMQPPVYQTQMPYDNGVIAKPYDPAAQQQYQQPYNPAAAPPQPYNPAAAPQPYNPAAAPQAYNPAAAAQPPVNNNPSNAYYPPQP